MEIKIVDQSYSFQTFITKAMELITLAPCLFYSNEISRLVQVTKVNDNLLEVNKRPATLMTDIDKMILEQSSIMIKSGLEDFLYDLNTKKPIYDFKTSRTLTDFYTYPVISSDSNNLLLYCSDGKLRKVYQGTGAHSILWAMRIIRIFPFIPKETDYTKFGFALYCRILAPMYGLTSPTFSMFYDNDTELLTDEIMRIHRELSTDTPELKTSLSNRFIEDVDASFSLNLNVDIPLSLSMILESGIPVTQDYEDVELDIKIPMLKKIQIKDGVLYLTPNKNDKVDSSALIEMFGEGYILVNEGV